MTKSKRSVLGENPFQSPASSPSEKAASAKTASGKKRKTPTSKPAKASTKRTSTKSATSTKAPASKPAKASTKRTSTKSATSTKAPASKPAKASTKRTSTKSATSTKAPTSKPAKAPTKRATASPTRRTSGNARSKPRETWLDEQDPFGYDPSFNARVAPWLGAVFEKYFRVTTKGIDGVPAHNALVVANHAGAFPYDGLILRTALRRQHPEQPVLRWLLEDHIYYTPFVGKNLSRLGAVRACQANGSRLLSSGALVGVFPEGAKGSGRLFRDRHRLQRFGRGGFVRLGLRTKAPVIPCAIVGPEEATPLLARVRLPSPLLGWPYVPVTPTFPWLGPLGLIPAPTRWSIVFGDPIPLDSYGPDAAEDEVLVRRLNERIRATIQTMLDRVVEGRRSVWTGS